MPQDTIVVVAFIVCVFVLFAGVLFWADRRTRRLSE